MSIPTAVLTISDSAYAGKRADVSGPRIKSLLEESGFAVNLTRVLPDEISDISAALRQAAAQHRLVVTTGGTGISARDVTPEATRSVCDRLLDGVSELMRTEGLKRTPNAALSRALCGTLGSSLVLNLPGSPSGAEESLRAVIGILPHALDLLAGKTEHEHSAIARTREAT